MSEWFSMNTAPRDRTPVLLKLRDDYRGGLDPERWAGLQFVGHHPGIAEDGFDLGWGFAAPVGYGGFADKSFEGWRPLSIAPDPAVKALVEALRELREILNLECGVEPCIGSDNPNEHAVGMADRALAPFREADAERKVEG